MRQYFFIIYTIFISAFCYGQGPLVVTYGTTHLNEICGGIIGVLITPSGERLQTPPLGPYEHFNIVTDILEAGDYQAFFESIDLSCCRVCSFAGGISAILSNAPNKPLQFAPKESLIQLFPMRKNMQIGTKSAPIATFKVLEEGY